MNVKDIQKEPIEHLHAKNSDEQRYELELLRKMNQWHASEREHDPNLETRIQAFELAFRMQAQAPDVFDVSSESKATQEMYGLGEEPTHDFGWQCLLSRRLSERGVRFVQCSHSGAQEKWDHHSKLDKIHPVRAKEVDKPIAGLLKDLKGRGQLQDTLVVWGGEFGRSPFTEGADGRDHNPYGFTMWIAGGGVKPGMIYGATDEFGYHAVEDRMHIHDLHATILHLLGMDHEKLTYNYGGRNFRLTDVHGQVAHKIFS